MSRYDAVCYCGDAPNPEDCTDIVHCWSCREFFHARCTGVAKEREMPMAWGEYLIWRFICRKCAVKHQQPSEHIERLESGLHYKIIGRIAVLNALKVLHLLHSYETETPLVAIKELIRHLPGSSRSTALGVPTSWGEIAKAIHCDDKLIISNDGSEVGMQSVSAIFPELSWKRRMSKSSENVVIPQPPANTDTPTPFLLRLNSDVEAVNRTNPLFAVSEHPYNDNITEYRNPDSQAQRTTSLHFDVISGICHKTRGWKVIPGTFIKVQSSQCKSAIARVIDILLLPGSNDHRESSYFAYVQWLVSPRDVLDGWRKSQKAEPHSCPGPSSLSKLMWLNSINEGQFKFVYGSSTAQPPSYPTDGSYVHSWLAGMSEVVDTASVGFTNELFLTLDTDYVDLNTIRFEPTTVHFVPMKEHSSGCVTCCNLINQPLSTTSRWYNRQTVFLMINYGTTSASVAAAVVVFIFSKRTRREEAFVTRCSKPLYSGPDFFFTYGFNPHTRGFFALPPAMRLVLELVGEYDGENLGQRMTELLKTCEVQKPILERPVMDKNVEVEVTDEEIAASSTWGDPRIPKSAWLRSNCGFSDAKKERLNHHQLDVLPITRADELSGDGDNDDLWERDSGVGDIDVFPSHNSQDAEAASRHLDKTILQNRGEEILKTDALRRAVMTHSNERYGSLRIGKAIS